MSWGRIATMSGVVGVAAIAQYAAQRTDSLSSSVGGDTAGGSDEVSASSLTPATRIATFAQCISKQDMRKGVWKKHSFDESRFCGEDSFFIMDEARAFGVADGVGGWAKHGVNPKEFSEKLMVETKRIIKEQHVGEPTAGGKGIIDLVAVVETACTEARKVVKAGSSTCCVATLDASNSTLNTLNVGDSGLLVIRGGKVVFQAEETSHGWNFPRQLGVNKGRIHGDSPHDGSRQSVRVFSGDLVVTASDGVFDNLSPDAIAKVVREAKGDANLAAKNVVSAACEAALTESKSAEKSWSQGGFGGKPDDVTVLVTKFL